MAEEDDRVKGTGLMDAQAQAGLKLFATESETKTDLAGATKYKEEVEAKIKELEDKAATLTGKDNKKERSALGKEVSDLKAEKKYIDATKVVKGLEPKNGFFVMNAAEKEAADAAAKAAVDAEAKAQADAKAAEEGKKSGGKDKPKKEMESTGLSPDEKKELEKLKDQIVGRKAELKASGMSGGQQNKDEQIVQWVTRMNELKEKENPGSTKKEGKDSKAKNKAPLSQEEQMELDKLRGEIEIYKNRLKTEFGYTNKDIKADADLKEMEDKLKALEKRA